MHLTWLDLTWLDLTWVISQCRRHVSHIEAFHVKLVMWRSGTARIRLIKICPTKSRVNQTQGIGGVYPPLGRRLGAGWVGITPYTSLSRRLGAGRVGVTPIPLSVGDWGRVEWGLPPIPLSVGDWGGSSGGYPPIPPIPPLGRRLDPVSP